MHDLYLKKLKLKNYCYYDDCVFDFIQSDGSPYKFICFFGPNGSGKTTFLEAILLLTMNQFGRSPERIRQSLRKYVHSENYNPCYGQIEEKADCKNEMLIEGIYEMDGKEYVVQLTEHGWLHNDFSPVPPFNDPSLEDFSEWAKKGPWGEDYLRYCQRICHFVTSDSDLSLNKFQLVSQYIQEFENIMTEIMDWPAKCILPKLIKGLSERSLYCTDYTITKTKRNTGKQIITHFKRMSAGERKITKSFSDLLNLMHSLAQPGRGGIALPGWPRLLLMDNVEMHAYYARHIKLLECLKRVFNKQQIFATTHSGVLIERDHPSDELWIDLDQANG